MYVFNSQDIQKVFSKNWEETMIVRFKHDKESSYTVISNQLIDDDKLTFKELGMMVFLLRKPDTWQVYLRQLASDRKESINTIGKIINSLREKGYIERKDLRQTGQFKGYEYTIYEKSNNEAIELYKQQESETKQVKKTPIHKNCETTSPIHKNTDTVFTDTENGDNTNYLSYELMNLLNTDKDKHENASISVTSLFNKIKTLKKWQYDINKKKYYIYIPKAKNIKCECENCFNDDYDDNDIMDSIHNLDIEFLDEIKNCIACNVPYKPLYFLMSRLKEIQEFALPYEIINNKIFLFSEETEQNSCEKKNTVIVETDCEISENTCRNDLTNEKRIVFEFPEVKKEDYTDTRSGTIDLQDKKVLRFPNNNPDVSKDFLKQLESVCENMGQKETVFLNDRKEYLKLPIDNISKTLDDKNRISEMERKRKILKKQAKLIIKKGSYER